MNKDYVPGQGFEVPAGHTGIDFAWIARRELMQRVRDTLETVFDRFAPPVAIGALCMLGAFGVTQASCAVGEGIPPATCRALENQTDEIIGKVVNFVDPRPEPPDELQRRWQEGDYPVQPAGPPTALQD